MDSRRKLDRASANLIKMLWELLVFSMFLFGATDGVRTKKKIYIDLKSQSTCFRIFNSTHEIGCASERGGNVGTVHYIQTEEDYEWILEKGPNDPYVAVLDSQDFTGDNVNRLRGTSRVNGLMIVTRPKASSLPERLSMAESCPNDQSGLYSHDKEYQHCQKVMWNTNGTGFQFQDIGFPVFSLTLPDDIDNVLNKCFFRFNKISNESRTHPVCAAEMKVVMDGAVDSRTCIRRSNKVQISLSGDVVYCDPMGGKNVITTMKSLSQKDKRDPDSVIMLAAKLDSAPLFLQDYHASDTTVAALVTMLVTAKSLWSVRDELRTSEAKDIMFAFFQGETFDYIGSNRAVYDMEKKKFPQEPSDSGTYMHNIELSHLGQILELNQVGYRMFGRSLFAHDDPLQKKNPDVHKKVTEMVDSLQAFGQQVHVDIEPASDRNPLPPASAQSFLLQRLDIPTVVLTDHKDHYTNLFYNSPYDVAGLIRADYPQNMTQEEQYNYVTVQAQRVANLSTTVARYLFKASTGKDPLPQVLAKLTGEPDTATHLLYCFLQSPNCTIFKESLDPSNAEKASEAQQPYPFYVSVPSETNAVTRLVFNLMARFTGEQVANVTNQDNCESQDSTDKRFSYTWMSGPSSDGQCIKSTVQFTLSKSPAFDIEGYDLLSGKYPTWTESRWQGDSMGIRLFLVPSQQFQVVNLCVGIAIALLSLVLTYYIHKNPDVFPNPVLAEAQAPQEPQEPPTLARS